MTLKDLQHFGAPLYLTTIEDPWGYPVGLAYPDGTVSMCEPSNVGKHIHVPLEGDFVIVWDGAMPDRRGGLTKGSLLD
jgi:hypothetical protein